MAVFPVAVWRSWDDTTPRRAVDDVGDIGETRTQKSPRGTLLHAGIVRARIQPARRMRRRLRPVAISNASHLAPLSESGSSSRLNATVPPSFFAVTR